MVKLFQILTYMQQVINNLCNCMLIGNAATVDIYKSVLPDHW